jgi:hypothetical protein
LGRRPARETVNYIIGDANRLRLLRTVSTRGEASSCLTKAGDAILVERGRPRWLIISCPCGCGDEVPLNLDQRVGPAWRIYVDGKRGVSLFPSVWRESGCQSHFVVWRDVIYLFGRYDREFDQQGDSVTLSTDSVRRLLRDKLTPYATIADKLDAVPWDVLTICRRLVRAGVAREGKGKQRDCFGRVRKSAK